MAKAENSNSAAEAARSAQPDVQAAFNEAFAAADSFAAQRLQTVGKLHQARIARLTREAAGLARQGDAGAASLAGARAEIAAEKITVAKAAMLNQRAATADPQVPPSGWALHGRVYSSELAPAAGCTVFLVDPQNAYQSAYGFAYTDATGYFVLDAAAAAGASGGAAPALYVAVADAKGEPVYRSATAFAPNPGVATYQTHVLPAGGKPIGDPPPAIRNIALPKREEGKRGGAGGCPAAPRFVDIGCLEPRSPHCPPFASACRRSPRSPSRSLRAARGRKLPRNPPSLRRSRRRRRCRTWSRDAPTRPRPSSNTLRSPAAIARPSTRTSGRWSRRSMSIRARRSSSCASSRSIRWRPAPSCSPAARDKGATQWSAACSTIRPNGRSPTSRSST